MTIKKSKLALSKTTKKKVTKKSAIIPVLTPAQSFKRDIEAAALEAGASFACLTVVETDPKYFFLHVLQGPDTIWHDISDAVSDKESGSGNKVEMVSIAQGTMTYQNPIPTGFFARLKALFFGSHDLYYKGDVFSWKPID